MAEFCLKCFNKMNATGYTEKDVILEDNLCEGCGEIKPCVIVIRKGAWKWKLERLWRVILPVIVLLAILSGIVCLAASIVNLF